MSSQPARRNFCGRTRREFLWQAGSRFHRHGAGRAAWATTAFWPGRRSPPTASRPGAIRWPLGPPQLPAKAKSVIFLFMYGGPSHIDTFDYKPDMKGMDNKTVDVKTFGRGGHKNQGRIVEPRWEFDQHGECGKWVSTLFPHLATCVDDIAFLHSMTADSPIHGSAMLMMNSGKILSGSPCIGSWVNYGLGTENENLPGFVVMLDPRGGPISGAKNWSSGYMPATYQATVMRSQGTPILDLSLPAGSEPRNAARDARHAFAASTKITSSRGPTTRICRPASPATNWRTRCKPRRPRRSTCGRKTPATQSTVRRRRKADRGLRPAVPAGAAAGRARRAVRAALLGRQPQRRQLGRPRRPEGQPQSARRRDRQADRRPAEGPEAARACWTRR